jgi:membrane protease YdiL (CAAX protease family)
VTTAPAVAQSPTSGPWGSWTTFGWTALALVLGQAAATLALLAVDDRGGASLPYDGPVVALSTLILNPVQIAVLAAAARRTGMGAWAYFGLRGFKARDLALGIVAGAALAAAIAVFALATGRALVTPFQIATYLSTPNAAWLLLLALSIVVVAPFGEEIVFRGFLFRGWVRPGRSPALPIVAIAALWTLLHVQYDWFGMAQVFLLGLLFGWMRWRSGSTTLTFVLHTLVNLESAVETVVAVGWAY